MMVCCGGIPGVKKERFDEAMNVRSAHGDEAFPVTSWNIGTTSANDKYTYGVKFLKREMVKGDTTFVHIMHYHASHGQCHSFNGH